MPLILALASTFQVTEFDIYVLTSILIAVMALYYFVTLHRIFEAVFGAIVGLGIYILLSVLLLGNAPMGSDAALFPLGFSIFLVSIAVYLVFILAVLFPLHGGLVINEPTQPALYTILYIFVSTFFIFTLGAIVIYMIEQSYVFRVGNILTWFRSVPYYTEVVRTSWYYNYVISHQNILIPLGVVLMIYKLLLSNLINAALLSIWYNLSHVGFYRQKDDAHYRVEFHEVGGSGGDHGGGHDDHGGGHDDHGGGHDDHGGGHDDHGHGHGHH